MKDQSLGSGVKVEVENLDEGENKKQNNVVMGLSHSEGRGGR